MVINKTYAVFGLLLSDYPYDDYVLIVGEHLSVWQNNHVVRDLLESVQPFDHLQRGEQVER